MKRPPNPASSKGRVIVVDPEGHAHAAESGTIGWLVWTDGAGKPAETKVELGRFPISSPVDTKLTVRSVVLGGRTAYAEEKDPGHGAAGGGWRDRSRPARGAGGAPKGLGAHRRTSTRARTDLLPGKYFVSVEMGKSYRADGRFVTFMSVWSHRTRGRSRVVARALSFTASSAMASMAIFLTGPTLCEMRPPLADRSPTAST